MISDALNAECKKRTLLLVSCLQFGFHIDTFEYCRYLRTRYNVTYLCLDHGLPRKNLDGVEVVYCSRNPFKKVELGLLLDTLQLIRSRSFDVVYLSRTKFSFLVRLLNPRVPVIFDVRTGSIETGALRRFVEDWLIWFNSLFFPHITVISTGLAGRLHLPRRAHVVPLGADRSPTLTTRRRGALRLVYVGTFKNRALEKTIVGLSEFLREVGGVQCSYSLIGFGPQEDVDRIIAAIKHTGLGNVVKLGKPVDHDELSSVLAEFDVGIAFTPRVPYYEFQPSTKVFEYLGAGLVCVATDNAANREIITPVNGILIDDSADGVRAGLHRLVDLLPDTDPEVIADTVREHSWYRIVNEKLAPLIERVMVETTQIIS